MNKISKKQRLLNLFESIEWINTLDEKRGKIITKEHLSNANFSSTWEYGDKYNDIIYFKKIIKALGYKVQVGSCIFVYEK